MTDRQTSLIQHLVGRFLLWLGRAVRRSCDMPGCTEKRIGDGTLCPKHLEAYNRSRRPRIKTNE